MRKKLKWGVLLIVGGAIGLSGCSEKVQAPVMSEQAHAEWVLLEAKMQEYEKAAQSMSNLAIENSNFQVNEGKPEIRFSVRNKTSSVVHQLQVRLELYQPDESVPVLMEYMELPIAEGLLPKGVYSWALSPSDSTQWQQLPDLGNSKMVLEIERATDKQGVPLYSVMHFHKRDRLRLLELREQAGK